MCKYLFKKTFTYLLYLTLILCEISYKDQLIYVKGAETFNRIVNGSLTNINNANYVVSLRQDGIYAICGGSLVSPKFVITAAHCVSDIVNPSQLTVVGGITLLSETGVRRVVSKIIKPKEYNGKTGHFDIAVLKLSGQMRGNNIGTIELCKDNWKLGDSVTVYGWGRVRENGDPSFHLRTVNIPLVARKRCSDAYEAVGMSLTDTMFCAGAFEGKGSCQGDSGGPIVFKNQLCGVVSWAVGCARPNFPSVFTNIRAVRNFIDRAMKL